MSSMEDSFLDEAERADEGDSGRGKCGGLRSWKWALTVLSVFVPPLAVFLGLRELGMQFVISCILFIFGWIGGVIHALSIIWCTKWVDRAYTNAPYVKPGTNPLL